jgi:hypothetical protein
LPKISATFGGIADNTTYQGNSRGYTSYTGFVGFVDQVLPSLSVTGRGGGSYTETVQSQAVISPYALLSVNWQLGMRSNLSFNYSHQVTPSDQVGANGATSDQFSSNFRYDITSSLSSHLQGIFTSATTSQQLATSAAANPGDEDTYSIDTGLTYHYNSYLSFDLGFILSGVISEVSTSDYTRQELYFGVRGTY